mgnify:CR=1 FL=1
MPARRVEPDEAGLLRNQVRCALRVLRASRTTIASRARLGIAAVSRAPPQASPDSRSPVKRVGRLRGTPAGQQALTPRRGRSACEEAHPTRAARRSARRPARSRSRPNFKRASSALVDAPGPRSAPVVALQVSPSDEAPASSARIDRAERRSGRRRVGCRRVEPGRSSRWKRAALRSAAYASQAGRELRIGRGAATIPLSSPRRYIPVPPTTIGHGLAARIAAIAASASRT